MTGERHVGHDVPADEDQVGDAERVGRLDVGRLPHHQHRAPDHPGHPRRIHDADRDDDVEHAGTERGHQRDGQHDGRKGHQSVHDAHDHVVETAVVSGGQPARHPEHERERHHRHPDQQRQPRAVHDPAPHVAADVVGAEPVRAAGRGEPTGHVHVAGIAGDERRQHAERHHDHHEDGPDQRGPAPRDERQPAGLRDRPLGGVGLGERDHAHGRAALTGTSPAGRRSGTTDPPPG